MCCYVFLLLCSTIFFYRFLASFFVDAKGGVFESRQTGIRVNVPKGACSMPTRITCRPLRYPSSSTFLLAFFVTRIYLFSGYSDRCTLFFYRKAVIKFDMRLVGSKSLKVPKFFILHKRCVRRFYSPTILCKSFSNFIPLQIHPY